MLVMVAIAASARPGRAQAARCDRATTDWVARCARSAGLAVEARGCPSGRLVASVTPGDGAVLDVEIGLANGPAFRKAGRFGVSPIGDFPDWNRESPERRRAFDAIVSCVARDPSLTVTRDAEPPTGTPSRAPPPPPERIPWLLFGGGLLALAACGARRRPGWPSLRALAGFAALAVGCYAFRRLALPSAFFHQNGHGPEWIQATLSGEPRYASYGPGYAQLFGAITRRASAPDLRVFFAQSLAAALTPVLAWIVARRAGARRALAGALALAVAVDPVLGRIAQSESYFATGVVLLYTAAAVLMSGTSRVPTRALGFWLAVTAAGLFIAQAASVHPLLWLPSATLPLVVLAAPGRLRARLTRVAVVAAALAAVVAVTVGPSLVRVYRGELSSLGSSFAARLVLMMRPDIPLVAAGLIAAVVLRRWRRLLVPLVGCAAVALVARRAAQSLEPNPAVAAAWARVFWPTLTALFASSAVALFPLVARVVPVSRRGVARALAVAVAGLAVGASAVRWRALTRLPTDALEQSFALEWRARLPPGAIVTYLDRVGNDIMTLPLYDGAGLAPRGEPLSRGPSASGGAPRYYYRSSLCSLAAGAPLCAAAERGRRLERLEVRELPAIPSMRWSRYQASPVRVELARERTTR